MRPTESNGLAWGIASAQRSKIWAVRLKVPGLRFALGDGQCICDGLPSYVIATGFGVEVKCFTGFTKSDPEYGDWTWAPCWLPALCIFCQ